MIDALALDSSSPHHGSHSSFPLLSYSRKYDMYAPPHPETHAGRTEPLNRGQKSRLKEPLLFPAPTPNPSSVALPSSPVKKQWETVARRHPDTFLHPSHIRILSSLKHARTRLEQGVHGASMPAGSRLSEQAAMRLFKPAMAGEGGWECFLGCMWSFELPRGWVRFGFGAYLHRRF